MAKQGRMMRTAWLAVIPVVLLVSSTARAQGRGQHLNSVPRIESTWAVNHPSQVPAPAQNHMTLPPGTVISQPNHPPVTINNHMILNTPTPPGPSPAVMEAPRASCRGGHCAGPAIDVRGNFACFLDWLCYKPIRGGCGKRASCGGNCSVPLYAYTINECCEGRTYDLPPCVEVPNDTRPHILQKVGDATRSRIQSRRRFGQSCSCDGCMGASGHQVFGQPMEQNACCR